MMREKHDDHTLQLAYCGMNSLANIQYAETCNLIKRTICMCMLWLVDSHVCNYAFIIFFQESWKCNNFNDVLKFVGELCTEHNSIQRLNIK